MLIFERITFPFCIQGDEKTYRTYIGNIYPCGDFCNINMFKEL